MKVSPESLAPCNSTGQRLQKLFKNKPTRTSLISIHHNHDVECLFNMPLFLGTWYINKIKKKRHKSLLCKRRRYPELLTYYSYHKQKREIPELGFIAILCGYDIIRIC